MNSASNTRWGILALVLILAVGTAGYVLIEGWPVFDAFWMALITITTVGYGEVHPLSSAGRLFSALLIVGGVGGALYTLNGIVQYVVEGQMKGTFGRRRMQERINKLKDHYLICGYGRVGQEIAAHFQAEGIPFVIVEQDDQSLALAAQEGRLCLQGDATQDAVLLAAGIERARCLVAAVGGDADNTFITLTARGLNPKLFVVARGDGPGAEGKLRRAGADRVILPHSLGGRRMAMLALHPTVVDFIDTVTVSLGQEWRVEDLAVPAASPLDGLTLAEGQKVLGGVMVVAVKKGEGQLLPNPPPETRLEAGDKLVMLGSKEQFRALEASLTGGRRVH